MTDASLRAETLVCWRLVRHQFWNGHSENRSKTHTNTQLMANRKSLPRSTSRRWT